MGDAVIWLGAVPATPPTPAPGLALVATIAAGLAVLGLAHLICAGLDRLDRMRRRGGR